MYADVSEALARAYNLHAHEGFFSVGTFEGLAPPPPIPKSWLRTQLLHTIPLGCRCEI